ncbi:MAG: hypothetical protein HOK52_14650 [Candidatus Marinimicrobia bacterium]|jgi:hypothetical protein|nr:hypothetical protein [Candidatus Neomarinimicrobiota bacterium]
MSQEIMNQKDIALLPSNPKEQDKIRGALKELSDCKTRMDSEKELMKEIADNLKEDFGLSRRLVNSMVATYMEGNYINKLSEMEAQIEEYEIFYSGLFKPHNTIVNQ